jgi:rhamnosyltransferase
MTTALPEVVVLMAVYNGAEWLQEQVASILAQQQVSVRLVINVDRSTDDSRALCEKLASENPAVSVLPGDLCLGSATSNFLYLAQKVEVGSADFVAFSDQDDIWDSDKLDRSIRAMAENAADGVSSDVEAFWPNGRRRLSIKSQPQRRLDFVLEAAGNGMTYLISKALWGDFVVWLSGKDHDKMPPHDWLLYAYSRLYGYRWHIMAESTVLYRQHDRNVTGANLGFKARIARVGSVINGSYRKDVQRLADAFEGDFPIVVSRWALLSNWSDLRRRRLEAIIFAVLCALFW